MFLKEETLRQVIRKTLMEARMGSISGGVEISGDSSDKESDSLGEEKNITNFSFQEIVNETPAKNAENELSIWRDGNVKETEEKAKNRLSKYWNHIKDMYGKNPEVPIKDRVPWSAAFISFVTKDKFFHNSAHNDWKEKAVENRKKIEANPEAFKDKELYVAFEVGEPGIEPTRGNNIWKKREGGSHSDIVVSSTESIGGNLSDSVKKVKISSQPYEYIIKKIKVLGKKKEDSPEAS